MKRIILMVIKRFYIAPIWFFIICKYGNEKYSEEVRYNKLFKIVKGINKAGKVKITTYGKENIPKENGYIMFPNHQGLFDVLALIESHDKPLTAVIKSELKNNFFLKRIIRVLKAQTIDRDNIRQSLGVINQMTKEVKEGRNYVIFSEGTRSKNGNKLNEFKSGSFKSAVNAKCPIVPIAIVNSYKVFDTNSIKGEEVFISFLEPLYYSNYSNMKTTEISEVVKSKIEKEIEKIVDKYRTC